MPAKTSAATSRATKATAAKETAPVTAAAETTEEKTRKPRTPLADFEMGEFKIVDTPITQTRSRQHGEKIAKFAEQIQRSWEMRNEKNQGKSVAFDAGTPEGAAAATALLRRAAGSLDLGIRTKIDGSVVTFAAWQKKDYKPRAKADESTTNDAA